MWGWTKYSPTARLARSGMLFALVALGLGWASLLGACGYAHPSGIGANPTPTSQHRATFVQAAPRSSSPSVAAFATPASPSPSPVPPAAVATPSPVTPTPTPGPSLAPRPTLTGRVDDARLGLLWLRMVLAQPRGCLEAWPNRTAVVWVRERAPGFPAPLPEAAVVLGTYLAQDLRGDPVCAGAWLRVLDATEAARFAAQLQAQGWRRAEEPATWLHDAGPGGLTRLHWRREGVWWALDYQRVTPTTPTPTAAFGETVDLASGAGAAACQRTGFGASCWGRGTLDDWRAWEARLAAQGWHREARISTSLARWSQWTHPERPRVVRTLFAGRGSPSEATWRLYLREDAPWPPAATALPTEPWALVPVILRGDLQPAALRALAEALVRLEGHETDVLRLGEPEADARAGLPPHARSIAQWTYRVTALTDDVVPHVALYFVYSAPLPQARADLLAWFAAQGWLAREEPWMRGPLTWFRQARLPAWAWFLCPDGEHAQTPFADSGYLTLWEEQGLTWGMVVYEFWDSPWNLCQRPWPSGEVCFEPPILARLLSVPETVAVLGLDHGSWDAAMCEHDGTAFYMQADPQALAAWLGTLRATARGHGWTTRGYHQGIQTLIVADGWVTYWIVPVDAARYLVVTAVR